ncbi:hypothetical protein RclHR1_12090002 [Rhizophagus clarus]|nr:hypothetical protein RclHR1_12090002 [Rhizophagus clarus]
MKSFKIIKEASEARKLIGYFATWNQVSKCINSQQLWNDVSLSWCRYFTPRFGLQKRCSTRFGNAENSNILPNTSPQKNINSTKISGNHKFHNQNKKDNNFTNSDLSNKKNSRFKMNQSNRSDVNELIAGLKVILEQFT